MQQLAGKVAFITGGGSGIGLGMAQVFGGAGMKVVIADVRRDHLEQALATLAASGVAAHGIALDVSHRAAFGLAVQETLALHGKVHLLCNNAGVSIFGPMDAATYDDWDWIMGVNVDGVINGVQSFLPALKAHGEGSHIVNTASMAGLLVGPGMGLYSASKYAVVGMTQSLRLDLAPHGIGVSVLCPGFVRSNIHEAVLSRPKHLAQTGYPVGQEDMKRLDQLLSVGMTPLDVAQAVLRAVTRNDAWIFPHAEFAAELRAEFDAILAALPAAPPNAERMKVEDGRRARKHQATALADRK
jgi:NAD(P)-dependent dehydrogenase (short-subunit alcohol dehydrogenase family)